MNGFDLARAAMAVSGVTAPERSVLLVLAIMANDDAQAWPPISGPTGLTTKCVLSERAVQRSIKRLCALGHLKRRQLRHGCVYTVEPKVDALTPATVTGVTGTGVTGTGDTQSLRPATVAPKQPVTTKPKKASPSLGKRATQVPSNFQPVMVEGSITAKAVAGWPPGRLDEEVEHFIDKHTSKGTLSKDWQASWRNWVKLGKKWEPRNGHGHGQSDLGERLRGGRPDPAFDLGRIADAELAAERACSYQETDFGAGASLPAYLTG